jgi:superfamily II DNA helicase RecQ
MTLTASALPATEHSVASSLALTNPVFVRRPLNRTNIFYTESEAAVMVNISHYVI